MLLLSSGELMQMQAFMSSVRAVPPEPAVFKQGGTCYAVYDGGVWYKGRVVKLSGQSKGKQKATIKFTDGDELETILADPTVLLEEHYFITWSLLP